MTFVVVNVRQRASLYKTIDRLLAAELISVRGVERDQRFPERTVYEVTEAGLLIAREWLVEMLAVPRNEYPRFPAALSFIFALPPDEVRGALHEPGTPPPPRVTLLEAAREFLVRQNAVSAALAADSASKSHIQARSRD